MRRLAICFVLFLVTISAATGVHASTECEKWLTEYKNSLAHSPAVHRVRAAHRRLHRYIHRKLAVRKKPAAPRKPRLLPARHRKPKMSREELLKRLELACGDLPGENPPIGELAKTGPAPDFTPEMHDDDPIELASVDGGFIPALTPPSYTGPTVTTEGGSPGFPFMPPIGGSSPRTPSSTPVTSTSCDTQASTCQPPTDSGPPPLVTPEPGTLVLLLTGIPGAVGVVRRRRRA